MAWSCTLPFAKAGSSSAANMTIMKITTTSSINVNPLRGHVSGLIRGPGQFSMTLVFIAFSLPFLVRFIFNHFPRECQAQMGGYFNLKYFIFTCSLGTILSCASLRLP
jgi:hypothetical protein